MSLPLLTILSKAMSSQLGKTAISQLTKTEAGSVLKTVTKSLNQMAYRRNLPGELVTQLLDIEDYKDLSLNQMKAKLTQASKLRTQILKTKPTQVYSNDISRMRKELKQDKRMKDLQATVSKNTAKNTEKRQKAYTKWLDDNSKGKWSSMNSQELDDLYTKQWTKINNNILRIPEKRKTKEVDEFEKLPNPQDFLGMNHNQKVRYTKKIEYDSIKTSLTSSGALNRERQGILTFGPQYSKFTREQRNDVWYAWQKYKEQNPGFNSSQEMEDFKVEWSKAQFEWNTYQDNDGNDQTYLDVTYAQDGKTRKLLDNAKSERQHEWLRNNPTLNRPMPGKRTPRI